LNDKNYLIGNSKSIRLQWNEFRIIYGNYRLFIQYNTLIETSQTSLIGLNRKKVKRLELLKRLSDKGMTNKEISDHLNSLGIKTPKGKSYYPNLIWSTLKKYKKRLDRENTYKIISHSEELMIQPIKVIKLNRID